MSDERYAKIEWAKMTNRAIAKKLGMTSGGVGAARKRLGAPPSPAGWGGYRWGEHSTGWYRQELRRMSRGMMHGHVEQLVEAMVAAKRKGRVASSSDKEFHSTDWYRERVKELGKGLKHGQLEELVKLARSFVKKAAA
jgi:hypothetical protein